MRYLVALGVIVGVARLLGWGPFAPDRARGLGEVKLAPLTEAAASDPCAGRRCVIVYMAPWCPSCKGAKPLVRTLRTKLPAQDAALKVVIGQCERAAAQAMASEVGGAVFFDPDGAYYRAMKANGVPSWLALDRDQRVLGRMAGYVLPAEAHLARLGL